MHRFCVAIGCIAIAACGRAAHDGASAHAGAAASADERTSASSAEKRSGAPSASSKTGIHVVRYHPIERIPAGFPVELMPGTEVSLVEQADEGHSSLIVVHSRVAKPFDEVVTWYRAHIPSVSSADAEALSVLHGLTQHGFYSVMISREDLPMRDGGASAHEVRIDWSETPAPD